MVVLPHANGYEVTDNDFVCAWVQIVSRFGPPGADPYTVPIPRLSTRRPFAWYQDQEARCCTLEYLLRIIAPESYQGTAQATQPFINANWIVTRAGSIRNASSGRLVEAVALSPNAPKCDAGLDDIESLFEADKGESDSSPTDVPQSTAGGARNPYSPQELHLVRCLVDQIHQDPFSASIQTSCTRQEGCGMAGTTVVLLLAESKGKPDSYHSTPATTTQDGAGVGCETWKLEFSG